MTTGWQLTVSDGDPTPPYEQLRQQLAALIGSRSLSPGERLPPLRQLAGDLGLAAGTVARTYRELEAAGLVTSRRGAGTRVADTAAALSRTDLARQLEALALQYVRSGHLLGADGPQLERAVRKAVAQTGSSH